MRHRIKRCLIWVCTVGLCPIYRTLGLNGLNSNKTIVKLGMDLLWFFGDFRCGALLFVVIHVIYTYKNR